DETAPAAVPANFDDPPIHIRPIVSLQRVRRIRTPWVPAITARRALHPGCSIEMDFFAESVRSQAVRDREPPRVTRLMKLSLKRRMRLFEAQNWRGPDCAKHMDRDAVDPDDRPGMERIFPVSPGGPVQTMCPISL